MGNIKLSQQEIKERTNAAKAALNSDLTLMELNIKIQMYYRCTPFVVDAETGIKRFVNKNVQKRIDCYKKLIKHRTEQIIKYYSKGGLSILELSEEG